MRRPRRCRETYKVSLFPFLAVLICTFGVLFIMLVLAVKAADESSRKTNREDQEKLQQQIEEIDSQLDLELVRNEGLAEVRPELLKRLQGVRESRTHLEYEIAKLNEQAAILARQLQRQEEAVAGEDLESIDKEIGELKKELSAATAELNQKQIQAESSSPVMYSIVPYDGVYGESRVPIYIECRNNKLIMQPHDVVIALEDFAIPVAEQNPLDAALVAVREYFLRHDLIGVQGNPYPLLVVRPDGAQSYSFARHAMRGWDDEFGYELISENKKLHFGTADPQLSEEIRLAVEQSILQQREWMRRRQAIQSASRSQGKVGAVSGLRASSQYGGFVKQSGDSESGTGYGTSPGQRDSMRSGSMKTDEMGRVDSSNSQTAGVNGRASQPGGTGQGASLAQQRGGNWALPSRTAGAVGYRRPIRVYCSSDEITFEVKSQSSRRVRIKIGDDMVVAVDTMVDEIWRMIESWGGTGANGYWVPELRFTVAPGGEDRMEQLRQLLKGSGLVVEGVKR